MILTPLALFGECVETFPDDILSEHLVMIQKLAYEILDPDSVEEGDSEDLRKWSGHGTNLCGYGMYCAIEMRKRGLGGEDHLKMFAALQYLMAEYGESSWLPRWMDVESTFIQDQQRLITRYPGLEKQFPHAQRPVDHVSIDEAIGRKMNRPKADGAARSPGGFRLEQFRNGDENPFPTGLWLSRESGLPSTTWLVAANTFLIKHMVSIDGQDVEMDSAAIGAKIDVLDEHRLEGDLNESMFGLDSYFHWTV